MKQQFLDLNGLTELVTYLKKSITEQKEILPYASNKLFPSTGNVNAIYIDTATNIIYRWDESSETYKILAQAIKSVAISESDENGKVTLTVDGVKTTVPIHGLKSAAFTESSAYSLANHTHTKAQIGLGNVDNTADANKSVKYSASAGTATKFATACSINGTNFDGSKNITTATWGTARNITIGNTKKSVNGGADASWSLSEIGAAAASHSHSYLPLSGGTMSGTATITWADSGNCGNSNKDVTFPVIRGGLSWLGQSDGIQLYAVETQNDNLELYLKFTDDNSNGLSIRNKDNTQTARISATGEITASRFVGNLSGTASAVPWSGITGKPSTFTPASHTHNYAGSSSAGGSANSAVKLDTATAGSAIQPVYFSSGKPVACSYTLGKSVPADALFTDHTYGNMKGATSSSAGSAGLVPAPNIGEQLKFLRADGAWVIPTNTTYSVGTSSYLGITKLYTETGSATDGTMTQNAITTALNGKSATGHTHNYAGSSSAGGAATSAIKLSTPRKIGNASFDGTADITLSQMGLNVPVEITKADYLAKKKAGTLNANTYYNVIDEYDSVNVINDSSITTNSAFSSTKSEKTYAKKSTLVTTTLTASKWTGSSAPYTYVLPVSGVTTSNIVEINYASNASSQAIEAYQNAMLADGGQTTNQITIKATEKPTVDIPITIVIRNDL